MSDLRDALGPLGPLVGVALRHHHATLSLVFITTLDPQEPSRQEVNNKKSQLTRVDSTSELNTEIEAYDDKQNASTC